MDDPMPISPALRDSHGGREGGPLRPMIEIRGLSKTYASGFEALKGVDLDIRRGEIFALLGPNGAGKTTLINIVCGLVRLSGGDIRVDGLDIDRDYRQVRAMIGLVPQELPVEGFETVWNTVSFSRGLFGKPRDPARVEAILRELSLWDKKDAKGMTLSGGMKRRLIIAKALAHDPAILFLDEPSAGVDVDLRQSMWQSVRRLRESGVTIILTTHYIEEAEEMADRVGIINQGSIIVAEEKTTLMAKFGRKQLVLHLASPLAGLPPQLEGRALTLSADGSQLQFTYDARGERTGITTLLNDLAAAGIRFTDLETRQSSLQDIFVDLVRSTP